MNPGTRWAVGLGAAGIGAAAGVWAWAWLARRRRKDPAEAERIRRLDVNRRGRIATAKIVDLVETPPSPAASWWVVYRYEVAGVTYVASQDVSVFPDLADEVRYLAGRAASTKYDPKKPSNSIIACEEWCGVPKEEPAPAPEPEPNTEPGKIVNYKL